MSTITLAAARRVAAPAGVDGAVLRGLRFLCIELRRSALLWLMPLMAALAAYAGTDYATAFHAVPTGQYTSATLGWSTLFLAPLLAAATCWAAGRDARQRVGELLTTTATVRTRRELLGWGAAALWGLATYSVMNLLLVVFTDAWGAWGRPAVGRVLVGVCVLLLASALGHAVGSLLPWRLLPPLVGVAGVFLLVLLPEDERFVEWQQLAPVTWLRPWDYNVLYQPVPLPLGDLLLWLGGLTLAALALPGVWRREWLAAVVLVGGLVFAGLGATQLLDARSMDSYRPEDVATFTPTCVSEPFPLCVHPAYADRLPQNAAMAARLLEPLAGIPGAPLRIAQRGYGSGITPDGTLLAEGISQDVDQLALSVAQEATQDSGRPFDNPAGATGWQAQVVIGNWLLQRVGFPAAMFRHGPGAEMQQIDAALERFAALDAATQRAWLEEHYTALRNGEITLEELP